MRYDTMWQHNGCVMSEIAAKWWCAACQHLSMLRNLMSCGKVCSQHDVSVSYAGLRHQCCSPLDIKRLQRWQLLQLALKELPEGLKQQLLRL